MKKLLALTCLLAVTTCTRPPLQLDYSQLDGPLESLAHQDRDAVQDAIQLIQRGEHSLALARLSSLNKRNPSNSSLRILTSYALLQAGNFTGAFEEAEKAHAAPDRLAYKCWFLGKVAELSGNQEVADREMAHLEKVGQELATN